MSEDQNPFLREETTEKRACEKKGKKNRDRLVARGTAPAFETDCRFQKRERSRRAAWRAGISSHVFLCFFSSLGRLPSLLPPVPWVPPRLFTGPVSAALRLFTAHFTTVCLLSDPLIATESLSALHRPRVLRPRLCFATRFPFRPDSRRPPGPRAPAGPASGVSQPALSRTIPGPTPPSPGRHPCGLPTSGY